ncbi:MAG: hypothetical protein QXG91_00205 [Candidatus Aenigmatarchaeota archaeon]
MKVRFKKIEQQLFESGNSNNLKYLLGTIAMVGGSAALKSCMVLNENEFAIIEKRGIEKIIPGMSADDIKSSLDIPLINFLGLEFRAFPPKPSEIYIVDYNDKTFFDFSPLGFKIFFHLPFPFENHYIYEKSGYFEIYSALLAPITSTLFTGLTPDGVKFLQHYPTGLSDIKSGYLKLQGITKEELDLIYLKIDMKYEIINKDKFTAKMFHSNFSTNIILNELKNIFNLHYSSPADRVNIIPGITSLIILNYMEQYLESIGKVENITEEDIINASEYAFKAIIEGNALANNNDTLKNLLNSYLSNYGIKINEISTKTVVDKAYKAF